MTTKSRAPGPTFRSCIFPAIAALVIAADPAAGATRVSKSSAGVQANGRSNTVAASADGQVVAFVSEASNLTGALDADTNGVSDVFVHDRRTHETVRVSRNITGIQGNSASSEPAISADGRFIAFSSSASNLDASVPDTNGMTDVFVHDRTTGRTTQITRNGGRRPALSGDGQRIAFLSSATDLDPADPDTNLADDVFVLDRATGRAMRVSKSSAGMEGNEASGWQGVAISHDGRIVAFYSEASNFVDLGSSRAEQIYVHDMMTRQTTLVSRSSTGEPGNSRSINPALSADGRLVAFESGSGNLDRTMPAAHRIDIFVHDRSTGETTLVSKNSAGAGGRSEPYAPVPAPPWLACPTGCGSSFNPSLSAHGRYVAFASLADNFDLTEPDTNFHLDPSDPGRTILGNDIFVHDRATARTARLSKSSAGEQGNNGSDGAVLSGDGQTVAFLSAASNLTDVSDPDSNGTADAFVVTDVRSYLASKGVQADRFEANDTLARARAVSWKSWRLEHALCVPWPFPSPLFPDAAGRCPGVFENYGTRPWSSADQWTLDLTDLSLDSTTDRDFFRVSLPEPSAYPETADIRPEAERLHLPTARVPLPECDTVRRIDLTGHGINVSTWARLDVAVIPTANSVANFPVVPSGEDIHLYQDGVYDKPLSKGPALHKTIYCPRTYESLSEIVWSFGERAATRLAEQPGGYTMQLTYTIEAHRGVPDWLRMMAEGAGIRTIIDLPCPHGTTTSSTTIGAFPTCRGDIDGPLRLEVEHPTAPRFPDCIADGPECFEPFLVQWPATQTPLDLIFAADLRFTFRLLDAQQKTIAVATPWPNYPVPEGQAAFRLSVQSLPAGLYALLVQGPPGPYGINFRSIQPPAQ